MNYLEFDAWQQQQPQHVYKWGKDQQHILYKYKGRIFVSERFINQANQENWAWQIYLITENSGHMIGRIIGTAEGCEIKGGYEQDITKEIEAKVIAYGCGPHMEAAE